MKGAHYRPWNWPRPNLIAFVFGLCLFGFGIGLVAASAHVGRVSSTTTSTTIVPTTTVRSAIPTTTRLAPKPVEIGKPLVIQRMSATSTPLIPTTTTTTEAPKTPLEVAQAEVGKTGPYAEGGFWCAQFQSWLAEQAHVEGFEQSDSPARLYAVAKEQGRLTDTPQPGYLVFIDLTGQNFANAYVSHVGIVESVDGALVHTIEGNADNSGVVTRQTRQVGDGYVIAFAAFGP